MLFSSALRILLNASCFGVFSLNNSTYPLSVATMVFTQPDFPALLFFFFVEVADGRLLEPVLHTVVQKKLPTNSDVSERDLLQRVLLSIVFSRPLGCSSRLHICPSQPLPTTLHAVFISQEIPGVADVLHCTGWSWNHPLLEPLPLTVSSNIAEPQHLPVKQSCGELRVLLPATFRHLRIISQVCARQ